MCLPTRQGASFSCVLDWLASYCLSWQFSTPIYCSCATTPGGNIQANKQSNKLLTCLLNRPPCMQQGIPHVVRAIVSLSQKDTLVPSQALQATLAMAWHAIAPDRRGRTRFAATGGVAALLDVMEICHMATKPLVISILGGKLSQCTALAASPPLSFNDRFNPVMPSTVAGHLLVGQRPLTPNVITPRIASDQQEAYVKR